MQALQQYINCDDVINLIKYYAKYTLNDTLKILYDSVDYKAELSYDESINKLIYKIEKILVCIFSAKKLIVLVPLSVYSVLHKKFYTLIIYTCDINKEQKQQYMKNIINNKLLKDKRTKHTTIRCNTETILIETLLNISKKYNNDAYNIIFKLPSIHYYNDLYMPYNEKTYHISKLLNCGILPKILNVNFEDKIYCQNDFINHIYNDDTCFNTNKKVYINSKSFEELFPNDLNIMHNYAINMKLSIIYPVINIHNYKP
jgi:hypothetical protein